MIRRLYSSSLLLSLFHRFTVRYWISHWIKLALLISIVALGTGSFLAIGLANRSVTRSFDRFTQTFSGQSQVVVTANIGSLSLSDLKDIRLSLLDSEAEIIPQVQATVRLVGIENLTYEDTILTASGIDLLTASNFLIRNMSESNFFELRDSDESKEGFYSSPALAQKFGWKKGTEVSLFLNDNLATLIWLGDIPGVEEDNSIGDRVIVLDWRILTRLLNRELNADRVDLIIPEGTNRETEIAEAVSLLEESNPGNWVIESQVQRQETGANMTLALRMNLRALSVLSLLIAVCLVFQSMDSAITKRQSEVAILRSIGVQGKITALLWLADSALIGFLGGLAGIGFGSLLARFSTKLVGQTVETLYHKADTSSLNFDLSEAALALSLTIGLSLIAGWWPARQAARAPMIESLHAQNRKKGYSRKMYLSVAALFSILSYLCYLIPPFSASNGHSIPIGGYLLAITLIGLATTLACLLLEFFGNLCKPLGAYSITARVALSQFRLPATRHRLALSGVILSVGMTAAMVILIGSFESTVRAWIGNILKADLFIRSGSLSSINDTSRISNPIAAAIMSERRLSDSGKILTSAIRIDNFTTQLTGFDTDYVNRIDNTTWLSRPDNLLDLKNGDTAIINETFEHRFKKSVGDSITLPLKNDTVTFTIIGVYADYGNESGTFGIDKARYSEITGDSQPRALALHVANIEDIETLAIELRKKYPALEVVTNRWLREETLRIFNRVFSITYALEAIGLTISVAGLGSMLASLLIERRTETGALLRIGYATRDVSMATLWEGSTLAVLGIGTGLVLGGAMGLVLVYVINRQSFGWTLALNFPLLELGGLATCTLAGASAVSYFVGRWSANQPILSEE